MSDTQTIRLIPAPISIVYDAATADEEAFAREYQSLSESDDDPIGQWLKLAKARGETSQTDPVLLNLIVELHRKLDALEAFLKNETPKRVPLAYEEEIDAIGFEHFRLKRTVLEPKRLYYGRIMMPVHPKRDVAIYFQALDNATAQITKMHERDQKEWNSYVTARERVLIREMKEKKR